MHAISIVIADDHPLILAGLAALIGAMPECRLLGQATDGRAAVEAYLTLRPDVVLMDLAMPVRNGLDAIGDIMRIDPNAKIIVLTTYQGEEDVYRATQAGASGYLLKDTSAEQLLECICAVADGRRYLPPEIAAALARRLQSSQLSARELDILAQLASGKCNKNIARHTGIELGTVKFHVNNILTKLAVASRTEAATVATQRGLLNQY